MLLLFSSSHVSWSYVEKRTEKERNATTKRFQFKVFGLILMWRVRCLRFLLKVQLWQAANLREPKCRFSQTNARQQSNMGLRGIVQCIVQWITVLEREDLPQLRLADTRVMILGFSMMVININSKHVRVLANSFQPILPCHELSGGKQQLETFSVQRSGLPEETGHDPEKSERHCSIDTPEHEKWLGTSKLRS